MVVREIDCEADTAVEIRNAKPLLEGARMGSRHFMGSEETAPTQDTTLDTVQGEIVGGVSHRHVKTKTIPFARQPRRTGVPFRIDQRKKSAPPTSEHPRIGHRYLNYRIQKQLARGSMGVVYQAVHCHLDRPVAIKFLSPHLLPDPNMVYRFLREAKAMAKLRDPGIPTIFDFGQDHVGNAYLVMEYFDGNSLAEHLTHARLSIADSLELSAQISQILATAHQAGITHRDLKPDNIMMSPSPGGMRVKIIDFGVCKVDAQTNNQVKTVAGNLLGTLAYMAPEQTYACSITPKADTYALGCILYELISGQPPFDGQLAALVEAHRHETPPRLDLIVKEVPTKLASLIGSMMAKDPTHRPPSGVALTNALRLFRQSMRSSRDKNATATHQLAITSISTSAQSPCSPSNSPENGHSESSHSPTKQRQTLPPPRPDTAQSALDSGQLHPEATPEPWMSLALPTKTHTGFSPRRAPGAFPPNNAGNSTGLTATTQLSVASPMLRMGIVIAVIAAFLCSALAASLL